MKQIKLPKKYCIQCSKEIIRNRRSNGFLEPTVFFLKRKFCNYQCCADSKRKPIELLSIANSRGWARRIKSKGLCEVCNKNNGCDVHHIDNNPRNNDIKNLMRICRSCHCKVTRPRKKCAVDSCNETSRKYNYCEKHSQRFIKYGTPFGYKENQFSDYILLDK